MTNKKYFFKATTLKLLIAISIILACSSFTSTNTYAASTKTTAKKALASYRHLLSKKTYIWTPETLSPDLNKTSNLQFACADLNGDGIKELILYNKVSSYADNYIKVFTYKNNRTECILSSHSLVWYKKVNIIETPDAHTGTYWSDYYSIDNGSLTNRASYEATDSPYCSQPVKYSDGMINYTSFKINGRETSHKNYQYKLKKLLKGSKESPLHFHDNKAKYRDKFIK